MVERLLEFTFPSSIELERVGNKNRINIFRKYFATIRYNRLLIQLALIRSAYDENAKSFISELENHQRKNFFSLLNRMKELNFYEEFISAAKEEEKALKTIIEAYGKRMNINE
ncbi:MAG: hypothetical protein ACE5SW_04895 [Nitrososphaeraceae archaeon]